MNFKNLIFFAFALKMASCSPYKNTPQAAGGAGNGLNYSDTLSGDHQKKGLSYKTAVVINATTESEGVNEEYKWIRNHYSNYKVEGQSLNYHGNKNYDIIQIKFTDERELKLYFDISSYYGQP
jgi:hypothetical protein